MNLLRDDEPVEVTLAQRMASGPLPLAYALRCASDIATSLRGLHAEGVFHGSAEPNSIVLRSSGAVLLPPNISSAAATESADLAAYGAVLYQLVTGSKPTSGNASESLASFPQSRQKDVQIAATRLASRCLNAEGEPRLEMSKIVTEVRLLSLTARGYEHANGSGTAQTQPAAGSPSTGELREPSTATPSERKCPKCRTRDIRASRPRTRIEEVMRAWRIPLLRCHRCFHRYILLFNWIALTKPAPLTIPESAANVR